MRKVKGLTNRLAAMFLSGLLVVGAVPGTVLASEIPADTGQTSEIPADTGQTSEIPAYMGQTLETEAEDMGKTLSEEVSAEGFSEDAALQQEEAAVQYYTVTLDANGGYFENEWDDSICEVVEQAEVISKQVPVGGTVAAAPVFTEMDQNDQAMTFAGWSLEPDGELVIAGDEEYAPADSCTLYAVWEAENPYAGDIGSDTGSPEIAEENTDQIDAAQDSVEVDEAAEGSQDVQNSVEADETAEESRDVQNSVEADEAAEGSQEVQGSVEAVETEGSATGRDAWDNGTAGESSANENPASEADTDPETIDENEQAGASDQEAVYADEDAEQAGGESSDADVTEEEVQSELTVASGEEETVSEDAAMAVVESGTCGDGLTWTLDEEGTLTISGFGKMKYGAFINNESIKKVIIKELCLSISDYSFFDCRNLTSIDITDSVTSIGIGAFDACSSLTSIDIPDSVTSIGDYAFSNTSLTSITIPKKVVSIGENVFDGCSSLENIFVEQENQNYSSENGVLFNSDQTILICYPGGGEGVYSIPDTVTSIGNSAFRSCGRLTSITIPDRVTSIGEYAFYFCSNLAGITIPDSVTSIGNNAFSGCSNLVIYCYSGSKAEEYAGENNIPFKILINRASATIPDQSYTYTGDPLEPEVTVILNETQLTKGTDYEVAYSNNTDVGVEPATVTVTGKGDYAGKKELTFTIEKAVQTITASDLTLPYPESGKIMVSGNQGQLSYMSSDISVAEVDTSGNVVAKKVGTATITITAAETKNYKKTEKEITVTVVKGNQTITASDLSLTYLETGTIIVSGNVGDLTYESYNTNIATVYTNGKVTAMGAGDTKILITALETENYKKTTKEITVNVAKAAQSITASDLSLTYPKTGTIKVSGNVGDLTYKSANEKVATVDDDGKVTAAGAGDTKITITAAETANYKKAAKEITVNVAKAAQSITVSNLTLAYPKTGTIKVSGNEGKLTYESANEKVATVDTDGKVKAQGPGSAKITVTAAETANYKKTEKEITVTVVKGTQPVTASDLSLTYPNSGQITISGNKGSLTFKSSDSGFCRQSNGKERRHGKDHDHGSRNCTVQCCLKDDHSERSQGSPVHHSKGLSSGCLRQTNNVSICYRCQRSHVLQILRHFHCFSDICRYGDRKEYRNSRDHGDIGRNCTVQCRLKDGHDQSGPCGNFVSDSSQPGDRH